MNTVPTLVSLLPAYRRYLTSLCYAKGTVTRYVSEADAFAQFASHHGRFYPQAVRAVDLETWQKALVVAERYELSTIVTRMRGLRAFFSYLADSGILARDPFVGFPMPRLPGVLPRDVLTVQEVLRLLHQPVGDKGDQGLLIIEVLYATGLRVGELCALDVADLDLSRRLVHVRRGKGAKDRVVPMGRTTAARLRNLVTERLAPPVSPQTQPVFLSARGQRISATAVQAVIRRGTTKCRIAKHVTPHVMRHTCATHMHARGAGILHVKDFLGHADVASTQIYTRVAPREAQRTHRDKHPREREARRLRRKGRRMAQSALGIPRPSRGRATRRVGEKTVARRPPVAPLEYGLLPANCFADEATREWVAAYADHLRVLNRCERTVRAHVARLRTFFAFSASRGVPSCLAVSRRVILDYREHLASLVQRRKSGSGAEVRNQFLSVVLCFFRFLAYREALAENPGLGVRYAREPSRLPRGVPSPLQIASILNQPDINTPVGLRDRAILEVLYSCGLRKEELMSLTGSLRQNWT